jgi:endoglucanase
LSVLKANGTAVYVDGGHSTWVSATEMALRLTQADIAQADGFSLNVSNFRPPLRA